MKVEVNEILNQRIDERIEYRPNGCWLWTGKTTQKGYAYITYKKNVVVHRYMWERANGPIPDGLQIDHLCRNRACINPDHMELVTPRENILRGRSPVAVNARKKYCKYGHKFTKENTVIIKGHRFCKICRFNQSQRLLDMRRKTQIRRKPIKGEPLSEFESNLWKILNAQPEKFK